MAGAVDITGTGNPTPSNEGAADRLSKAHDRLLYEAASVQAVLAAQDPRVHVPGTAERVSRLVSDLRHELLLHFALEESMPGGLFETALIRLPEAKAEIEALRAEQKKASSTTARLKAEIDAMLHAAQVTGRLDEASLAELPVEVADQLRTVWRGRGQN